MKSLTLMLTTLVITSSATAAIPVDGEPSPFSAKTFTCNVDYSWPKGTNDLNFDKFEKSVKLEKQPEHKRYVADLKYTTADGRYEIEMHAVQPLAGDVFRYDIVGLSVLDKRTNTLTSPGRYPSSRKEYAVTTQAVHIMPEIVGDQPANGLSVKCEMK